jgi:YD repeat-containing protein
MGLLESSENAMGGVVSYKYDKAGNILEMTDANGHIYEFEYDKENRMTGSIDPMGNKTVRSHMNTIVTITCFTVLTR